MFTAQIICYFVLVNEVEDTNRRYPVKKSFIYFVISSIFFLSLQSGSNDSNGEMPITDRKLSFFSQCTSRASFSTHFVPVKILGERPIARKIKLFYL